MSWSVIETWENQDADRAIEANGIKGTTVTSRSFSVTHSTMMVTPLSAMNAPGIPQTNSPHPISPSLRALRFGCQQVGPNYFIVTVGYEGATPDPEDPSFDPLFQPPNIEFVDVTQEVEIDEDVNGAPIQTVNGEPIAGVTRPFTDLGIIVQRNLPSFDPLLISTYTNKVNSTTWYGLPAGTVRIMGIGAKSVFSNEFAYWDVTARFQVRRGQGTVTDARAWWYRTAHQGYLVQTIDGLVHAVSDDGLTVPQPVMLDLVTGQQLPPGVGAYIEFQVLEEIDFNALNLL
jgi:hypothetical protein